MSTYLVHYSIAKQMTDADHWHVEQRRGRRQKATKGRIWRHLGR